MVNKKQYYKLDDIGFVGAQEKRSAAQVKNDAVRTAEIIKSLKLKKSAPLSPKSKARLAKAK